MKALAWIALSFAVLSLPAYVGLQALSYALAGHAVTARFIWLLYNAVFHATPLALLAIAFLISPEQGRAASTEE